MFSWIYRLEKVEAARLLSEIKLPSEGTLHDLRRRLRKHVIAHTDYTGKMPRDPEEEISRRIAAPTPPEEDPVKVLNQIRKWGLHFEGKNPLSFLEHTQELRIAYGYSDAHSCWDYPNS